MCRGATIVLDLDDTLFPERDFVLSGFAAAGAWLADHRGRAGLGEEAVALFEAGARGRIFDEALRRLGVEPELALVAELVGVYRAHRPAIRLFPDARAFLESPPAYARLALITDGYGAVQRRKVEALGIWERFAAIMFTDDLGRENWKPSEVPFRKMMEQMSGDACSFVYVGDNPAKDFLAPNALGWRTVQIVRPGGEYRREDVEATRPGQQAQARISTLDELPALLEKQIFQ